jgi:hypothetical protein
LPPLRHKGTEAVQVLSLVGDLELKRRYFWSKPCGGCYPIDAALGIDAGAVSSGARRACCTMGVAQDFAQAAEDLKQLTGIRISKERLRRIVESEGTRVAGVREEGVLSPSWSSDDARVGPQGPRRIYVGADGVMVRTVTQAEKDKRRKEHAVRRQQRGKAGVENLQPLARAKAGSDDRFKEMKIGIFYNQSKTRKHAFATEGNHERFGFLLKRHAEAVGVKQCQEALSLTDGGPWIRNQILQHLQPLTAMLLDFFHFSEHVWTTARACWGDGDEARTWAEKQLHDVKHVGAQAVLATLDEAKKKLRSPGKQNALRLLRNYITERWEMVDYPTALAHGWDIGSGPTEAMCKNLTLRLKRTGMKWDTNNAAALMNLVALRESGQWYRYWQTRKIA